ncbi:phosphatidylcholine/phosphatidylserine synthase [Bradyrhizobium sp.]|uniref:CDP-alcohol phosphatidyltransferase family protein n=1 Tax=Bradyrhizobium sp. TaxID=376 RepID=UPI001EC86DBF|nr:phosphatidylcholine/phosphatidylserine synthase [Bradyrhizobium sp.]MBV8688444.1 phosphatidylcholine/phosphatidylserine synthase [Alphaproteobacteria bacterium]MBV9373064.1 phosphatidylcholine/phosphatidylserine synthase [Alphaproteobacteria bacterium]MBV9979114.1 phosphatidylcholine/phosphatidylserine synthase [Bradyrhizobium sp.]
MRGKERERRGIPLRAVVPNAVTALALCSGLTGIRFAIGEEWEKAIAAIVVAAVLDGMDGRIARMLKGASRFGAELDSLSDNIAFGVSPAVIMYLWSLQYWPRGYGWLFSLAYAVCMALRLARFNARIDAEDQPHKSAGFLTGVPAPAGAGLMLLPLYLWLASDRQWTWTHDYRLVAPWAAFVAFLAISSLATFSWTSFRLRRNVRLEAIVAVAMIGGALAVAPLETLSVAAILYVASIPFSVASYARVRRLRAGGAARRSTPPGSAPGEPTA